MQGCMAVTVKDVSREVPVSVATGSRVICGHSVVTAPLSYRRNIPYRVGCQRTGYGRLGISLWEF